MSKPLPSKHQLLLGERVDLSVPDVSYVVSLFLVTRTQADITRVDLCEVNYLVCVCV